MKLKFLLTLLIRFCAANPAQKRSEGDKLRFPRSALQPRATTTTSGGIVSDVPVMVSGKLVASQLAFSNVRDPRSSQLASLAVLITLGRVCEDDELRVPRIINSCSFINSLNSSLLGDYDYPLDTV